jgi:NAD(P)-dependent dehydrogenase (short-subunit alcohol dehydrogenase family)
MGKHATANFDFSGTTTVVTGGASGIGLSCALAVARSGGNLVISASRKPDKTAAAVAKLAAARQGIAVDAFPCEVGEEASVSSFFDAIHSAGKRIDYVIHSAGISPNTDFFDQTQKEWDQVQNTNATGAFLVTKHAARIMRNNAPRDEFRGKILLVTSTNGINSNAPVSAHYDSSKAAANMLVLIHSQNWAIGGAAFFLD